MEVKSIFLLMCFSESKKTVVVGKFCFSNMFSHYKHTHFCVF